MTVVNIGCAKISIAGRAPLRIDVHVCADCRERRTAKEVAFA